jgi:hypothetical protein
MPAYRCRKSDPNQTICDRAESLWDIYQQTGKEEDRTAYLRHVDECDLCFVNLKREVAP